MQPPSGHVTRTWAVLGRSGRRRRRTRGRRRREGGADAPAVQAWSLVSRLSLDAHRDVPVMLTTPGPPPLARWCGHGAGGRAAGPSGACRTPRLAIDPRVDRCSQARACPMLVSCLETAMQGSRVCCVRGHGARRLRGLRAGEWHAAGRGVGARLRGAPIAAARCSHVPQASTCFYFGSSHGDSSVGRQPCSAAAWPPRPWSRPRAAAPSCPSLSARRPRRRGGRARPSATSPFARR